MADRAAPTGRKLNGASRVARVTGGKLAGAVGSRRTKLPLTGGNPSAGSHVGLISGAQKFGKLPGAD